MLTKSCLKKKTEYKISQYPGILYNPLSHSIQDEEIEANGLSARRQSCLEVSVLLRSQKGEISREEFIIYNQESVSLIYS
jgi:hypothetical protein